MTDDLSAETELYDVVECAPPDGMLALRWEGMHVEMPLRPVSKKELMKSARSDQYKTTNTKSDFSCLACLL